MNGILISITIIVAIILWAISVYNRFIQQRVGADNAWSQIDIQLKRRHDLIPNLVEVVKGYASHERETLENVIKARQTAVTIPTGDIQQAAIAENALSGALRQLFALSETYPDLKANQNFMQLHEEIASTENKISFARQHFNDSVAVFNTSLQQIPNNIVAALAGFKAKDFFEVDAAEVKAVRQVPQVSFS